MNLYQKLRARAEEGNPVRVGMIGAGKFGSMFLAQAVRVAGIHLIGVIDLSPAQAKSNMELVGWSPERFSAASLDDAAATGKTFVGDDWQQLVAHPKIDIVIECTGAPMAAIEHALEAFRNGKHVINVTVEADAFCGPALAAKAKESGVIYSMAYGDQPALACDLVDWARTCGFSVVAAGRGHKWLPEVSQIDAGDRLGSLGIDQRAGRARPIEPERCSMRFLMAPNQRSSRRPSRMPPASMFQQTD